MRCLLLWLAIALTPSLVAGEAPLFDPQIGENDFQISEDPPGGDSLVGPSPGVVTNPDDEEVLAYWSAFKIPASYSEIYVQRLSSGGAKLGPEVRVTDQSQGHSSYGAHSPSAAYNPIRGEYLVAWVGDDFFASSGGIDVYVQRLDAAGGFLGSELRLTFLADGTNQRNARDPKVVHNGVDDEYLVVWKANDPAAGLTEDETEIFGLRLDGSGLALGPPFQISQMGAGGGSAVSHEPDLAFDPVNRWYLVVWLGADTLVFADQKLQIFGQLLDASGAEIGTNDFQISTLGSFDDPDFDAGHPAVELSPLSREWMVVWHGDDDQDGMVDDENEVFSRRLTIPGQLLGFETRLSNMGPVGDPQYDAFFPDLAYDPSSDTFLVTWSANDRNDDPEIYGQRMRVDGSRLGSRYRLSTTGSRPGDGLYASYPSLVLGPTDHQYLVVWWFDYHWSLPENKSYLFGQRLAFPFFCDGFESGDLSAWSVVGDR